MILGNWARRASEELHFSTARGRVAEGLFWPWRVFDFLRCTILVASRAAISMVVHLEADGLEAGLWPVSGWPTLVSNYSVRRHSFNGYGGGLWAADARLSLSKNCFVMP